MGSSAKGMPGVGRSRDRRRINRTGNFNKDTADGIDYLDKE